MFSLFRHAARKSFFLLLHLEKSFVQNLHSDCARNVSDSSGQLKRMKNLRHEPNRYFSQPHLHKVVFTVKPTGHKDQLDRFYSGNEQNRAPKKQ